MGRPGLSCLAQPTGLLCCAGLCHVWTPSSSGTPADLWAPDGASVVHMDLQAPGPRLHTLQV